MTAYCPGFLAGISQVPALGDTTVFKGGTALKSATSATTGSLRTWAPPGWTIGRRQKYSSRYNEFRRQLIDRERIVIHSYDWLVDVANINYSGWLTGELRGLA